jgi:hypothetical protein
VKGLEDLEGLTGMAGKCLKARGLRRLGGQLFGGVKRPKRPKRLQRLPAGPVRPPSDAVFTSFTPTWLLARVTPLPLEYENVRIFSLLKTTMQ